MSVIDCIEEIDIIRIKKLFFVEDSIILCRLPYPGHKNGCPNIEKSEKCPPRCMRLEKKYNLADSCYFVYAKFNITKQEKRMLKLHPEWTIKKARCLLYWQNIVRDKLKEKAKFYAYRKGLGYELIPEAMGLHVFETAHNIKGIPDEIIKNLSENSYDVIVGWFRAWLERMEEIRKKRI